MLIRETKYFYVLRAQFLSRRKVQRINCLTFFESNAESTNEIDGAEWCKVCLKR